MTILTQRCVIENIIAKAISQETDHIITALKILVRGYTG